MPAPVSSGMMSTFSSRRMVSVATPSTTAVSAFLTSRPSVRARLMCSMRSGPPPLRTCASSRAVDVAMARTSR